uniref:Uncharacterized protein n=1 Tax=Palpitomonas bilix TaxID=652834 RepID=A0A7S3G2N6_9EUKA|mmetsp:Transcript_20374/g.52166  ORF Transcript_20374/g.52166 Transcript_20374/m.52166 type:complete len:694 (+) Transcript_20374:69-2150(+)
MPPPSFNDDVCISTAAINQFLRDGGEKLNLKNNPCISPDFCLHFDDMVEKVKAVLASTANVTPPSTSAVATGEKGEGEGEGEGEKKEGQAEVVQVLSAVRKLETSSLARAFSVSDQHDLRFYSSSKLPLVFGDAYLIEDVSSGDCCWLVTSVEKGEVGRRLEDVVQLGPVVFVFPTSFSNILRLKSEGFRFNSRCTAFPSAFRDSSLAYASIGVGARFTTLHWPAVFWTMSSLGLSLTANQNSIPRELVYDVNAMLDGRLGNIRFPFLGSDIPEGHQGQSVEGMAHGSILTCMKMGFHQLGLPWGFNADHQPVGGQYDEREDALVRGCSLASYITFDISHELLVKEGGEGSEKVEMGEEFFEKVWKEIEEKKGEAEKGVERDEVKKVLAGVYPALIKMKKRDEKYKKIRQTLFPRSLEAQKYYRELSVDELPGLTSNATLAALLAACSVMGMEIHFVAPAFGFQKNFPFHDNQVLRERVEKSYAVASKFGVSIGFHSGSGKSEENYRVCGEVTGSHLEIKTSGRYTYEMGAALARSTSPSDQALFNEWFAFTLTLARHALEGKNGEGARDLAMQFLNHSLENQGLAPLSNEDNAVEALAKLKPSPDAMIWFEFNFLFVLAGKTKLGDHSVEGYEQRARFYGGISEEGRLHFFKNISNYILFLCETTGLAAKDKVDRVRAELELLSSLPEVCQK